MAYFPSAVRVSVCPCETLPDRTGGRARVSPRKAHTETAATAARKADSAALAKVFFSHNPLGSVFDWVDMISPEIEIDRKHKKPLTPMISGAKGLVCNAIQVLEFVLIPCGLIVRDSHRGLRVKGKPLHVTRSSLPLYFIIAHFQISIRNSGEDATKGIGNVVTRANLRRRLTLIRNH